jgi:hypothetical protein
MMARNLRDLRFLDRKAALAWPLRDTEAGILLNEQSPRTVPPFSRTLAGLALRASFPSESTAHTGPVLVRSGSRSAIPPASPCSGSGARFGIGEQRCKVIPAMDGFVETVKLVGAIFGIATTLFIVTPLSRSADFCASCKATSSCCQRTRERRLSEDQD